LKKPRTVTFITAAIILALVVMSPWVAAQPLDQQKADAQKDVEALQQRLEDAVERYNYACCKIEQTRVEIEQNEEALAAAEAELASNKDRLNARVRAMYVTRHNRFLDVMVNAGNFDEFLVGMDLAKKLSGKDAELVRDVKDAKSSLEAARTSLGERKKEQEAATNELAASKKSIEKDLSGAKGKLAGVEDQIKQAMEARLAEASSSSSSSRRDNTTNPTRPTRPPGAPNGGVVGVAYDQLGKPYVWGGAGPNSFDCSGLVQYCYRVGAGKYIPHSSYAQRSCGASVGVSQMAPGDIVGFRGWGHVGIYAGGGSYIHAPHSGDVVRVASLSSRGNYAGAVRP